MPRFKLTIEYDGGFYNGFQRQPDCKTVQGCLENALFAICGVSTTVFGAGRTDAGVHATGQVIHFDIEREVLPKRLIAWMNSILKNEKITILDAEIVDESFHARFSAIRRHYKYAILNRKQKPSIDQKCWWVKEFLDVDRMNESCSVLVGTNDLTSFCGNVDLCKSMVRTIEYLNFERQNEYIYFYIGSKSFLYHQVRNIVGTMRLIGNKKWNIENLKKSIDAKDRRSAGPTAPANALFFTKIDYKTP